MILNDHDIFMALRKMKEISGITGVHCENAEMIDALTEEAKKRGNLGADAHPRVRPGGAEAEAVNRLLAIAKEVDISVFVVHLTCREVLWEGLRTGKSQTVSTDHCSFTVEDKNMGKDDFTGIPNGMPGVETRAVLFYTYGVRSGRLTPQQMCRVLSENPAKLYGLYPEKGCILEESDADIKGTIDKVFLRGCLVTDGGTVMKEKQGKFIKRGPHML